MSLSGKVAIVTGSAQGLGKAFSRELLLRGAKVGLADINEQAVLATLEQFSNEFGQNKVMSTTCDVTSEAQMTAMFQNVQAQLGGLDIVINNAGLGNEFDGWEKAVDVNVKGTIQGSKLGIEMMSQNKGGNGGVIINVSSMAGINPNPCGPVYSATKGAIIMLSLSYAANPEITGAGIRVNVLAPAFADTKMFRNLGTSTQIHVPAIAEMIKAKVGVMTTEYVAESMMQLIEDENRNGAVMKLSKASGIEYHSQ